jgi:hypothetical protein
LLTLEQQRLQAAEASGGISSEVVYDRILAVIGPYDLRAGPSTAVWESAIYAQAVSVRTVRAD